MAAPMAISPTRMELIKLRKRIGLARRGHDLLTEKMDALIIEFFEVLKKVKQARTSALTQLAAAHRALSTCLAVVGTIETQQASRETRREIQLDASTRYVMGIMTPALRIERVERTILERGYSIHFTSSVLDDAAREFEKTLKLLVELAELEESTRAIARELEKTKRRANALEHIIIPHLKATIKFITMRLDEMERENFSRLKRIKAILEART